MPKSVPSNNEPSTKSEPPSSDDSGVNPNLHETVRLSGPPANGRPTKPMVYVAGPISHPSPLVNVRDGFEVWYFLFTGGLITPFVPHASIFQQMFFPMSYYEWLEYDREILLHCDALFRIPGVSPGADAEEEFMLALGRPVFHSPVDLEAWAHAWIEDEAPTDLDAIVPDVGSEEKEPTDEEV